MKLHLPRFNARRLLIAAGALCTVLVLWWGLCHLLMDTAKFKAVVLKQVTDASGYNALARDASLEVFPLPRVVLSDVVIENAPEATNSYFLTAKSVAFRLDMLDLLHGKAVPVSLTLDHPDLELERFSSKDTNWQTFFRQKSFWAAMPIQRLAIIGGTVVYTAGVDTADEFKNLNLSGTFSGSGKFEVDGVVQGYDHSGRISVVSKGGRFTSPQDFSFDLTSSISFGKENANYVGTLGSDPAYGLQWKGKLDASIESLGDWMSRLLRDSARQGAFEALPKHLPLNLSVSIDDRSGRGSLTLDKLQLGNSEGTGSIQWNEAASVTAKGNVAFSTLDLSQLMTGETKEEHAIDAFFGLLLPQGVEGEFTATAEKLSYATALFTNVKATTSLSEGEMVVNEASAMLPGDTRVFTFGIIKRDSTGRVNYDGSAELLGSDVLAFMKGIGLEQANIIPPTTQKFRAKAELFLAPRQGTISGLRFQAGAFEFSGGINLNQGGKYDTGMTLLFKHAKLDPVFGFFAPISQMEKAGSFQTVNRTLPWLKNVEKKYSLNLLFQDFTLGNRKGSLTQVSALVSKNHIDVDKLDLHLDDVAIAGSFTFHQDNDIPEINAALNLSYFNLTSLLANDMVKHPVPRGNRDNVWDTERFSFDYLRGYTGKFNLHVDHAVHPDFKINDLQLMATVDNGDWNISDLSGDIWGGRVSATSHLQALTVPAINTQFKLTNVKAEQMFDSIGGFQSLRGNTSVSGEFQTSGVNALDWVRNMTGAMSFRGDQFAIRGFDLALLVQTIPSVRQVADVVNTARLSALGGQSTFLLVEGSFYIDHGQLATKGITFRSRQAIGDFQGSLDLMHWMIDSAIDFKLITVATQDFPSIRITFQDSMDKPIIGLDTRSLEAFVARRKLD